MLEPKKKRKIDFLQPRREKKIEEIVSPEMIKNMTL